MRRLTSNNQHVNQLGQSMAEFALLLPLLLTLVLGTLDLGRSFYTYISLTNAAREAARYGALHNTAASSAHVQKEFTSGGSDISGCTNGSLTFSSSGSGRGNPYTVDVSCQFALVTPFVAGFLGALGNQLTISSTATFVVD